MSEERQDLLDRAQRLIEALETHSDPAVGDQARALLQIIDAVHRTALEHLVGAVRAMAGDAFMHRLTADPAVRLLLMSYDLLAVDRRLLAEEALDALRGHLHRHGVDVELLDVVGGAVYLRLHGLESSAVTEDAVRRDLEEALRAGLLGFQELVLHPREHSPAALVQLGGRKPAHRPVYRRAMPLADLRPGSMKAVEVDGQPLLLANLDGEVLAVRNRCGESPLPLEFGALEGSELRCSWHGCRYDIRTGRRLDGSGHALQVFPVSVQDDEILVAVGVEPVEAA